MIRRGCRDCASDPCQCCGESSSTTEHTGPRYEFRAPGDRRYGKYTTLEAAIARARQIRENGNTEPDICLVDCVACTSTQLDAFLATHSRAA